MRGEGGGRRWRTARRRRDRGRSAARRAAGPDPVASLYAALAPELRRFVLGVVRDPELADDVMQATFVKAIEQGHEARAETARGWLFRVAFHEALAARRRRPPATGGTAGWPGFRPRPGAGRPTSP